MLLSMLEALLKRANTPADAESNGPRPCPKLGRPTQLCSGTVRQRLQVSLGSVDGRRCRLATADLNWERNWACEGGACLGMGMGLGGGADGLQRIRNSLRWHSSVSCEVAALGSAAERRGAPCP